MNHFPNPDLNLKKQAQILLGFTQHFLSSPPSKSHSEKLPQKYARKKFWKIRYKVLFWQVGFPGGSDSKESTGNFGI